MDEQLNTIPGLLIDKEAAERFQHVIELGQKIFSATPITISGETISEQDITRICAFHVAASPANPENPWRTTPQQGKSLQNGDIVDPSSYSNWEIPGGPLEHINLASETAAFIIQEIQTHVKPEDGVSEPWAREAIGQIKQIEPLHAAAAAALHDEGREVTHLYYTTELIGKPLLRKMGVREDLLAVMPTEQVMLTPLTESIDEKIQALSSETVILRIADEFGKRAPGTNRLYQPEDYDAWDRQTWATNYMKRPFSGRPSDSWIRGNMQLHVDNVPRYFQALDTWVQAVSTLTLSDLTQLINAKFSPSLPPLPERK